MKATETLRAPAKLNLTLEVLQRRGDGLHALRSVMVPVDLCDELHIEQSQTPGFTCDLPELQEQNLVERALQALGVGGFRVELHKAIPTGAGMGGGSSDAAAILLAAQRGVFGPAPHADYVGVARSLGSDVPFFLVETAALVEGTGERVTALGPVPPWHAVVVKPPVHVSTARAYEHIEASVRQSRPRSTSVSLELGEALQRAQFDRVQALLQNDFHDVLASSTPEIGTALDALRAAGAKHPVLTGSGSCVFELAQTAGQAEGLASALALPPEYRIFRCAFWNGEAWRSAA
ncbi:MAG TPA: 4-(cytidine 5'-diphospho)-2-C-methyl-D-erythritol kinase [Candidatus Baltobacteraceae bacterium]|nr:4-(cytidine 5'-diphospho)-2-C-methyl-D-erythritol kinase [Candidatus Baltobacteraceae bacterium]